MPRFDLTSRMDLEECGDSSGFKKNLERFCSIVVADDQLHLALLDAPDLERFAALTVELAQKHGCHFTVEEVRAALEEKRRAWLQHWV